MYGPLVLRGGRGKSGGFTVVVIGHGAEVDLLRCDFRLLLEGAELEPLTSAHPLELLKSDAVAGAEPDS